ncbi:MAG TPA: hypothetical protein VFP84_04205 [Kofleriaceae bacterium]|nr:hypothetical protein [Kofleriaceae bacterium]
MTAKVFLGGEGKNDIGTRGQIPMGDQPGVVEVLLRKVRANGWQVTGAMPWQAIRKYRAGFAKNHAEHADEHNVRALVQRAYEETCEMLAFVRDVDGEQPRAEAIRRVLEELDLDEWAAEYGYTLAVAGGVAEPTLEAWILHLHGITNTDAMSKAAAARKLTELGLELKSSADYLAIAEACDSLPSGAGSLCEWLDRAGQVFARLIDGT